LSTASRLGGVRWETESLPLGIVTCLPSSVRMMRSLCDGQQPRQSLQQQRQLRKPPSRGTNVPLDRKPRHSRQSHGAQNTAAPAAIMCRTETRGCEEKRGYHKKLSDLSCTPSTTPGIHFKLVTFNQIRAVTCTFDMMPGCPSVPPQLRPNPASSNLALNPLQVQLPS
jgi:hypothetical protein